MEEKKLSLFESILLESDACVSLIANIIFHLRNIKNFVSSEPMNYMYGTFILKLISYHYFYSHRFALFKSGGIHKECIEAGELLGLYRYEKRVPFSS